MNIAIWGSKELGIRFYHLLNNKECNVEAFVDSDSTLIGKKVEHVSVISPEQLRKTAKEKRVAVLLALRNSFNIITVLKYLENCEVKDIGIIKPRILSQNISISIGMDEEKGEIIWAKREGKKYNIIPRLEVNIVDGCNLNCKGCSHFSNLFPQDSTCSISEYEQDLKQVRKLGKLVRLRLLGGEPFLTGNLSEYICIARRIFPEADIELVTNGLLIPKIDKQILREIRINEVSISISAYVPTLRIKKMIIDTLNEFEIWWKFDKEEITQFLRNLTLDKVHDGKKSVEKCMSLGCTFLRKGRIYKCPLEGLAYVLEKKYHVKFELAKRGVDIYDAPWKVYKSILDLITKPTEMCQYCSEEEEYIKWEINSVPILQDWIKEG